MKDWVIYPAVMVKVELAEERIQSLEKQERDFESLLNNSQIDKNQILALEVKLSESKEELGKFIQSFDRDEEISKLRTTISNLENDKIKLNDDSQDLSKEISELSRKIANLIKIHHQELKIISSHNESMISANVSFSFQYYEDNHDEFHPQGRKIGYLLNLLERLKALSSKSKLELVTDGSNTLRFHPIDWNDCRTSKNSFGLPNEKQLANFPYQFSLSANEHGRVHGFFINNIFYIVWLDPNHLLYSQN